jgi:hypothetical protein
VDECEAEADRDGSKAFGGALVGRAEDDEKEEAGEDDLDQKAGEQRIAARRVLAEAVGGEAAGERESFSATGDDVEYACGDDGSGYLGDDIGKKLGGREALAYD